MKGVELPFARGDEEPDAASFGKTDGQAFLVELGKAIAQLAQFGLQFGQRRFAQHAVGEAEGFVLAHERARQKLPHAHVFEKGLNRPLRQPVEIARDIQAHAVARQQVDQAQAIEPREAMDDLGFAHGVSRDDVVDRPMIERADRYEQELGVAHELALLRLFERAQALTAGGGFLRQLGHREPEQPRHIGEPVERQALDGEHALHARLGHFERHGDVFVGEPALFEQAFDAIDELSGFGHGYQKTILEGRKDATSYADG